MSDYRIDWPAVVLALPGPIFRLSGRLNRGQIWFRFMFLIPILFGAFICWWAGNPAGAILFYGVFLAGTIALQVRRLHDLGHSGWWIVIGPILSLIPLAGLAVMRRGWPLDWQNITNDPVAALVLTVPAILSLMFFVYLGLWPGMRGPNEYDRDPGTAQTSG